MIGGFVITPEHPDQIRHVFARIIFALRLRFQRTISSPTSDKDSQDCSIQQWLNGAKIVRGSLSAVITLTEAAAAVGGADGRRSQLVVTCRGPIDQRRQLFFLQVLLSLPLMISLVRQADCSVVHNSIRGGPSGFYQFSPQMPYSALLQSRSVEIPDLLVNTFIPATAAKVIAFHQ